jgi:hypothetical protein
LRRCKGCQLTITADSLKHNHNQTKHDQTNTKNSEVRHAYGRTALLLSGGGSLGSFHIGVVKALFEHRMLPRVLAGSSVGSIVAGIIATRTDDELTDMIGRIREVCVFGFRCFGFARCFFGVVLLGVWSCWSCCVCVSTNTSLKPPSTRPPPPRPTQNVTTQQT